MEIGLKIYHPSPRFQTFYHWIWQIFQQIKLAQWWMQVHFFLWIINAHFSNPPTSETQNKNHPNLKSWLGWRMAARPHGRGSALPLFLSRKFYMIKLFPNCMRRYRAQIKTLEFCSRKIYSAFKSLPWRHTQFLHVTYGQLGFLNRFINIALGHRISL